MIRLSNIHKRFFKDTDREVYALRGINLEIERGSFTVLIGSNGSGKSTLLNLVAGNLLPDTGRIFINDRDMTDDLDHKRSRSVSRVFQDPLAGTSSELTVMENFRLAALRSKHKSPVTGLNKEFRSKVIADITQLGLGLEHKVDQPIGTFKISREHGLTTLLVTHNLKDAEALGDRIIMLESGSVKKDLQGKDKIALSSAEIFSWF